MTADVLTRTELVTRPRSPLRSGRGLVGLVLVGVVVTLGLLAAVLAPYGPNDQIRGANLLGPSSAHLLGTDQVNRDVLSRLLFGIRIDLLMVLIAVPTGAVIGSAVGVLATWWSPVDVVAQRLFDVLLAFPAIILAIAVTAILGPGLTAVVVVIVAVEIPVFGRLQRSSVLTVRELPFVEAAAAVGAGRWWLLRRHILPNALEPVLVQLALSMSVAVFVESAMSFIGIGVRPPTPSVGNILADSLANLEANPAFAIGPLSVVVVLILSFQLIAQSLTAHRRR